MNYKDKVTTIRIRKIIPNEYSLTINPINPLIQEIVLQLTQASGVTDLE